MIQHRQTTTLQERLEITKRVNAGQSDPEIAAALGVLDLDSAQMATPRTTHMRRAVAYVQHCIDRDLVCCGELESEKVDVPDCRSCCKAIVGMYEL